MASEKSPRTSARTRKNIHQHPHLIMQTPSTVQIRTAIEVLKKYGEHLNHQASNLAVELAESPQAIHDARCITAGTIEQTARIETVAAQLEQWRDELMQQRRQCVCNHI
jgi:adenylosuccinate lyase